MSHGHAHTHSHRASEAQNLTATLALVVAVLAAEAIGGWLTNSLALLSDAAHMLTDVSALVLSLMALRFARRPADEQRTYGYHRWEILAALFNGAALLVLSILIGWSAYHRLAAPPEVQASRVIIFAGVAFLGNGAGLLLLARVRGSLNARAAYVHILGDTLASLGVIVASLVMRATHWFWLDPLLSIGIALFIVVGAVHIVREAVDVLLEAVPGHLQCASITADMRTVAGVVAVHDLHVWTITSGMVALSAHVVVEKNALEKSDAVLLALKERLHQTHGIDHTTIQIESAAYAHASGDDVHP